MKKRLNYPVLPGSGSCVQAWVSASVNCCTIPSRKCGRRSPPSTRRNSLALIPGFAVKLRIYETNWMGELWARLSCPHAELQWCKTLHKHVCFLLGWCHDASTPFCIKGKNRSVLRCSPNRLHGRSLILLLVAELGLFQEVVIMRTILFLLSPRKCGLCLLRSMILQGFQFVNEQMMEIQLKIKATCSIVCCKLSVAVPELLTPSCVGVVGEPLRVVPGSSFVPTTSVCIR